MGLGDVAGIGADALARNLERVRARPPCRMSAEDLPRLAPPHGAVVRLEGAEVAGAVRHLAVGRQLVRGPGDGITDARDEPEQAGDGEERHRPGETSHHVAPAVRDQLSNRERRDEHDDHDRSHDHQPPRAWSRP